MLKICNPVNNQKVKSSSESQIATDSMIRKQMFDRNSEKTMNTLREENNTLQIESHANKSNLLKLRIKERKKN